MDDVINQAPQPTQEMKILKDVLGWCYQYTQISRPRFDSSEEPDDSLLHYASKNGHLQIVEFLFNDHHIDDIDSLGENGQTALHNAAENGHFEIVKFLVNQGANVNAKTTEREQTPLYFAVWSKAVGSRENALKIAKLLIETGADIRAKTNWGASIFQMAVKTKKNNQIAKLLISKNVFTHPKDPDMVLACNQAVQYGNMEMVKFFMDKGVDVNEHHHKLGNGAYWFPPLSLAAERGHYEMCKLLIENGADVMELSQNGATALFWAIALQYDWNLKESKYLELIRFLIQKGVDVNAQTNYGITPLHVAILYSNQCHYPKKRPEYLKIAKILIENGANVNLQCTEDKETPLHMTKIKEIAELLLKNGARTDIKNSKGKTPREMSKTNRAPEVTRLIVEYENKQKSEKNEEYNCIICFNPKDGTFAFLPCGHAKTCQNCCKNIMQNPNSNPECPTCRQPVTIYQKIYI